MSRTHRLPIVEKIRYLENGALPLEREMIAPRSVSEDARLEEIFRHRM